MTGKFLAIPPSELDIYIQDSKLLASRLKEMERISSILDIDKTWDAISYLASKVSVEDDTGSPLSWLVFGDRAIDESQDLGYGPARYLDKFQVKTVHDKLKMVGKEDLEKFYDPLQMNALNIYPGFWDDEPGSFEYIGSNYERLKTFYSDTAEKEETIVMFIGSSGS
ncbi:MAG: YfbM family protein [Chitinophagaceae bacterium]|nr:YfbM family protein [Chitinophagaceae bacterium]